MGYCIINRQKGIIAWCNQYRSSVMLAREFGAGSAIIRTPSKFLRGIVTQIRQSW